MNVSKDYNIKVTGDEKDVKKALSLLQRLLHLFEEELVWQDKSYRMEVKINHTPSQDR